MVQFLWVDESTDSTSVLRCSKAHVPQFHSSTRTSPLVRVGWPNAYSATSIRNPSLNISTYCQTCRDMQRPSLAKPAYFGDLPRYS
jgi:hypothetical protein